MIDHATKSMGFVSTASLPLVADMNVVRVTIIKFAPERNRKRKREIKSETDGMKQKREP